MIFNDSPKYRAVFLRFQQTLPLRRGGHLRPFGLGASCRLRRRRPSLRVPRAPPSRRFTHEHEFFRNHMSDLQPALEVAPQTFPPTSGAAACVPLVLRKNARTCVPSSFGGARHSHDPMRSQIKLPVQLSIMLRRSLRPSRSEVARKVQDVKPAGMRSANALLIARGGPGRCKTAR